MLLFVEQSERTDWNVARRLRLEMRDDKAEPAVSAPMRIMRYGEQWQHLESWIGLDGPGRLGWVGTGVGLRSWKGSWDKTGVPVGWVGEESSCWSGGLG